jgi:peptidoglycan/LPS O-acetylase OafA/YrhL
LVPAAYFAVDTFFWIGGFLVTIGLLENMKKMVKFIPFYFSCIVHRLIRIWPTYILAILIFWKIAPYLSNGPIWLSFSMTSDNCSGGGFLWNMLFLDNFVNHGPFGLDYCFGWV